MSAEYWICHPRPIAAMWGWEIKWETMLVLFSLKERESIIWVRSPGRHSPVAQEQLMWSMLLQQHFWLTFLNNLLLRLVHQFPSPPGPAVSLYFRLPPRTWDKAQETQGSRESERILKVLPLLYPLKPAYIISVPPETGFLEMVPVAPWRADTLMSVN